MCLTFEEAARAVRCARKLDAGATTAKKAAIFNKERRRMVDVQASCKIAIKVAKLYLSETALRRRSGL
jgi:hypothetical protein